MLFQKTQMCFNEPDNVFLTNNYIYIINLLLKSGLTVVIFLLIKNIAKNWSDRITCLTKLHDNSFFSKSILVLQLVK